MQLQLIRNATLRLNYAGITILIDPDLAAKHARPSFTGRSRNPMVDLPISIEQIVMGLHLLLVSHLHRDHFDAIESLPSDLPVFCQPGNDAQIAAHGFQQVAVIHDSVKWNGIQVARTMGHHGVGVVGETMGTVAGFVLRASNEPTVYWVGDTVFCDEVQATITQYQPDVIITHSCGARWPDTEGKRQLIVMDATQTVAVCQAAPNSIVVATHMEALDHATISRSELRAAAHAAGLSSTQLCIPADGEILMFNTKE